MKKARTLLIYVPIVLFTVSLALPGIVGAPEPKNNQKYEVCSEVKKLTCYNATGRLDTFWDRFAVQCQGFPPDDPQLHRIEGDPIDQYCGYDWQTPTFSYVYGWQILVFGFFAAFSLATAAWFGNVFFAGTLMLLVIRKPKLALGSAVVGILFGLLAIFGHMYPTGWVGTTGLQWAAIDHLGVGYYLWEAAHITLALCTFLKVLSNRSKGA